MSLTRKFDILLICAVTLFPFAALAQKSPSSGSNQPVTTSRSTTSSGSAPSPTIPSLPQEQIMFISGKVITDDGSPIPRDVSVERRCNVRVVQQTHPSTNGSFSMEIGSMTPSPIFDGSGIADADQSSARFGGASSAASSLGMGSRRELANCELQASSAGFRSSTINLTEYASSGSVIDVGTIVLQRGEKVQGTTLSAAVLAAPKDAKKAYQKGMEAEAKGKLPEAKGYFEKAVAIYPKHAEAWVRLGQLLEHENDSQGARKAYSSALSADDRFVPPYLMLASLAARSGSWNDVLNFSGRALELDPLSYPNAYWYQAVANLQVDRLEAAEKSARAAERLDVRNHLPQVHLLLADILVKHENYRDAIAETQTYLKLAPNGKDVDQVKARLAELEKHESAAQLTGKP